MCIRDRPWHDGSLAVYMNIALEFDPRSFEVSNKQIIGTRSCYPDYPCNRPSLRDCAFTSGMTLRADGRVDLYLSLIHICISPCPGRTKLKRSTP